MKSNNIKATLAAVLLAVGTVVPALSNAEQRNRVLGAVGGSSIGNVVVGHDSQQQVNRYSHRDDRRTRGRHGYAPPRDYGYGRGDHRYRPAPRPRGYNPYLPHSGYFVPGMFQTQQANHVRQGPGRNYRSIGVLPAGTPVQIIRNSSRNDWVRVARLGREIGYVYAPHLHLAID